MIERIEEKEMKISIGSKALAFPTPVWVVATYDRAGKPNVMTAAWGGICCSSPPAVGVSLRKATYTYGNISERRAFTINVLTEDLVREADYFGLASGRSEDKLSVVGFSPRKAELVDAPYLDEASLVLECNLLTMVEIGLHTQFIGEIMDVKAEESVMGESGLPEMERVKPMVFAPEIRKYFGIGRSLGPAFSVGKEMGRTREPGSQ